MVANLDAKEVLRYLNDMGYRNITSSQLKEFIKDLRKLIKYEQQLGLNHNENSCQNKENKVKFNKDSTSTTANSRSKSASVKLQNSTNKPNENICNNEPLKDPVKKSESTSARSNRPRSAKSFKQSDPVELYHYYKRQWERFKKNLPGENSHKELRLEIKKKLLNINEK